MKFSDDTALNVPTSLDWSGAKPRKRAIKPSDSSRYVASLEEPLLVEGRRAPRSLESQQSLGQQLPAARQATTTYYQPALPSKRQHTHSTMLATCSAGKGRALTQHGFYRQFQETQHYLELSKHIYWKQAEPVIESMQQLQRCPFWRPGKVMVAVLAVLAVFGPGKVMLAVLAVLAVFGPGKVMLAV